MALSREQLVGIVAHLCGDRPRRRYLPGRGAEFGGETDTPRSCYATVKTGEQAWQGLAREGGGGPRLARGVRRRALAGRSAGGGNVAVWPLASIFRTQPLVWK